MLELEDAIDLGGNAILTAVRLRGWRPASHACRRRLYTFVHRRDATVVAMITADDFEVFCRRSFTGVLRVVDRLGDDLINRRPAATGGNSPFGLVNHILGACEWWVGHVVLGVESDRVRDEEFFASGTVAELHARVDSWLATLTERKPALAAATVLRNPAETREPLVGEWTVGAALIHAYEELAQHLGHLEITADLLLAEAA
jgi:hypothetical protein